jgi:lipopolysaccharide transport protein LptA
MGSVKFQARHFFKLISISLLLVVLAAIAISFVTRSKKQVKVPQLSKEIEERKIDKKEKTELIEFEGEKVNFLGKADRHHIGEDSLYHLEGNVEITFFDRSEGEDILLRGEEIIHDQQWTHFWLKGRATIEFKDLTIESSILEYDAEKAIFWSDEGVRFSSRTLNGAAQKARYILEERKVVLDGDVHLELKLSQEMNQPLWIDTEHFEYFLGKGQGQAEGSVELTHGESRASAGLIRFALSASREQIKTLFLKEEVKISLQDEFRKTEPFSDQEAFTLYGDRCEINAEEIFIKGFIDLPQIQRLEASGGCSFRFLSDSGSFTQIEGEQLEFVLSQMGRLKELSVRGDVMIAEEDKERGQQRFVDGQTLQIQGDINILNVEGKDAQKARIRSRDSEIAARHIRLFLKNNNLEAKEDTMVVIYPRKTSQQAIGFFSKETHVFITADDMRYSEDNKRFVFSGKVKLWQTKEMVTAQELHMDVDRGSISAHGGIQSVLPYRPKGKQEEEKISIKAGGMEYDAEKNLIHYLDKVELKTESIILKAQTLLIALEQDGGEMASIVAQKDVVLLQGRYEGRGEEARFDLKDEVITVVGNPILIDEDQGKTEGSKLTFYMADGRIVIENKDRERSETVIKS